MMIRALDSANVKKLYLIIMPAAHHHAVIRPWGVAEGSEGPDMYEYMYTYIVLVCTM